MKASFFLIALLLSSIAVVLVPVEAQEPAEPTLVIRKATSELWSNPDGTNTLTLGVPAWTFNGSKFVPHIFRDFGNNTLHVQSGLIGWKINPDYAIFTDSNMTRDIAKEIWNAVIDTKKANATFVRHVLIDNSTGVYVTSFYNVIDDKGGQYELQIIYAIVDGRPTERIIVIGGIADSVKGKLANKLKLEREWIWLNEPLKKVKINEIDADVTKTNEKYLKKAEDELVTFYDINGQVLVRENLISAGTQLTEITNSEIKTTFTYQNFDDKLKLTDATEVEVTSGTQDGRVETSLGTGTTCPEATLTKTSNGVQNYARKAGSGSSTISCYVSYFEWSIADIPTGSTISDTDFAFDVASVTNAINCNYTRLSTQPSLAGTSGTTIWGEIKTPVETFLGNDSTCTTIGDQKSLDLGAGSDAEVQSRLTNGDWFAVGFKLSNMTRESGITRTVIVETSEQTGENPTPQLTINYVPPTVTVVIVLNAATGSDTMQTASTSATVTCNVAGLGTDYSHDGDLASQNFTCDASTTVSITLPTAATSRFRFSDGSAVQTFTACSSGTCSAQTYSNIYRQFRTTTTITGVDSNNLIKVNRTFTGTNSYYPHSGGTDCAIDEDGNDDSVSISDHVDVKVKNNFSVVVWFTPYSFNQEGGDYRTIVTKKDNSTYYYNIKLGVDAQLSGQLRNGFGFSFAETGSGSLSAEKTYMAVLTWNSSDTLKIYLNEAVYTTGGLTATEQSDTTLMLGKNGATGEGSFLGKIYEFRFYDKTLSSTEVSTLYKGGHVSSNLKVYWKFDDCSGATVTDRSGNSHTGTIQGNAAWESATWADQSSNFGMPSTQVITTDQQRWATYNSTASRVFNVTSATTKSYVWQREFYEQFRVAETNTGDALPLNPAASYTVNVTLANSTTYALTLNTQTTDGYTDAPSRYWVKNGTQTFGAVTWRSIAVKATGASCSVTSYGNCDVTLISQHYGFSSDKHFRYAVDGGTANANALLSNGTFSFDATATGTKTAIVEFPTTVYSGVGSIAINGTSHTSFTTSDVGAGIGVITISNIGFSVKHIAIVMSTGVGGGGGGGGGGGSGGFSGTALNVTITIPEFNAAPGNSDTVDMLVVARGYTAVTITTISIAAPYNTWFTIDEALPKTAQIELGKPNVETTIPITVNVPENQPGAFRTIPMSVIVSAGGATATINLNAQIALVPNIELGYWLIAAVLGIFAVVGVGSKIKNRKR